MNLRHIITEVNAQLSETARQRRRTRLKKRDALKSLTSSRDEIEPSDTDQVRQPDLEDSTAGVASLLQKKLHQTEKEENQTSQYQTGTPSPSIVHNDEHTMLQEQGDSGAAQQETVTKLGEVDCLL